ncbi:hypothetical protein PGTUg99_032798 [Puccinia graminis f. sp. tritici]|uniref:Uncharacterized protein n=1 Tax=Puccinia graminis f. sp. tritici TaxID=56615 RepID=A0A5B0R9V0_PUCGR|nr:hypothetical protein PGTUg99_032798 [Puccinia graminis f. sp. tritici]
MSGSTIPPERAESEVEVLPSPNSLINRAGQEDPREVPGYCLLSATPFDPSLEFVQVSDHNELFNAHNLSEIDELDRELGEPINRPASNLVAGQLPMQQSAHIPVTQLATRTPGNPMPPPSHRPSSRLALHRNLTHIVNNHRQDEPVAIPILPNQPVRPPIPNLPMRPVRPPAAVRNEQSSDRSSHHSPALSMEDVSLEAYLSHALIPPGDALTRAQLLVCGITHWSFFRSASVDMLVGYGFPPGTAQLLCNGVTRMAEHYQMGPNHL